MRQALQGQDFGVRTVGDERTSKTDKYLLESETEGSSKSGGESSDSGSAVNTLSSKAEAQLDPESPISKKASSSDHQSFDQKHLQLQQHQQQIEMASDTSRTGGPSELNTSPAKPPQEKRKGSTSEKQLDAKTLRRLAQNREAARKSRLRKKAYVQQLESSRIKLTQLEQDLQRARQQGLFLGGCGGAGGNMSSGAAIFDMEYARWLEDDHRHMSELRAGLQAHLSDGDLRMLTSQLDPLTQQQLMGIYSLQHSSQQAEEALSQGLEQLQQSLIDTIATGPVIDGMQQMAVALGKLANLEGFVRQADNLRQQTLHQLRRILTVRQAARCFLVIGEYYGRLRALSSLWASLPRE
ncbi:hypothetical protein GH714_000705 [Hevea brasiliensis]|uniref:BZIP domain-containing protein n=1 Tax=Hevea brasiliensis TaxID=3981 RepID=A0A6A6N8G9_HEVBR|nr:hypothetical protein GH714_000705 [Hevea brasiliensis]